jgi:hypothetical protein
LQRKPESFRNCNMFVGIGAWEVLSFRWIRLDSAVVDHRPSSHIDLASET